MALFDLAQENEAHEENEDKLDENKLTLIGSKEETATMKNNKTEEDRKIRDAVEQISQGKKTKKKGRFDTYKKHKASLDLKKTDVISL